MEHRLAVSMRTMLSISCSEGVVRFVGGSRCFCHELMLNMLQQVVRLMLYAAKVRRMLCDDRWRFH